MCGQRRCRRVRSPRKVLPSFESPRCHCDLGLRSTWVVMSCDSRVGGTQPRRSGLAVRIGGGPAVRGSSFRALRTCSGCLILKCRVSPLLRAASCSPRHPSTPASFGPSIAPLCSARQWTVLDLMSSSVLSLVAPHPGSLPGSLLLTCPHICSPGHSPPCSQVVSARQGLGH